MNIEKLTTYFLACALLATATVAIAQSQPGAEQKQAMLERLRAADANGDGVIDKAEADAKLPRIAKNFNKLDVDQDGALSPDEFKAVASKFAERRR